MILNDKMTSNIDETVLLKCHVCSIPEVVQINWLRHDQIIDDVNILIKSETIDHYQCSQSIMEIVVCLTDCLFLSKINYYFYPIRVSLNINLDDTNVERRII
jgi:hypothetical protein